ncbi:uncharacterized protein BN736_00910 [Prevotella sp. CAG:617]|nr:uncharacterized protein BN736_00910 [Prevotella sp. CAG:617]
MLDFDDFTIFRANQGCSVVTVAEVGAFFTSSFFYVSRSVNGFGIHGYEGLHAVAAVDVKSLSNGAKAVSCINVTTVFLVVAHTPSEFVVLTVLPVVRPEVVEVVDVSTLCAEHFAEYAVLSHVQGVHFKPVVAAVLQNHAVLAGLFAQVDELPALVKVHGRRYFDGGVFTVLQSAFGYREVVFPVGSDVYEVDVFAFANFLVSLFTVVDVCRWKTGFTQELLAAFGTRFLVVAEGYNLYTGDVSEALYSTGTTHTQTYEGNAYAFHFRSGQVQSVFLSGRAFRRVNYDGSFVPMPFGVGRK